MFNAIIKRLKEVSGAKSAQEIASILKTTTVNVYTWNNRKKIPYEYLAKYCEKTGVSLDWLIFGKGAKFRELVKLSDDEAPLHVEDDQLDYIPYYEDILLSAGGGATNGDYHPKEMITIPKNTFSCKGIEAVKVIGDSMTPTIADDAIVFIDRTQTQIKNSQIYAIRIDNETYLKRLFQTPEGIIVKSDNKIYPQYTVKKQSLNIIGQVKGVIQKL